MEDKKLFIVEFGEAGGSLWNCCSQKPIYVVAKNYNEAADKAMLYVEYKMKNKPVITSDGSLYKREEEEIIKVNAVKLAGEEVLW
jgi:hypothetical protein